MRKEFFTILFAYLALNCYVLGRGSECPSPKVMKRTIIRSKESIKRGAVLIGKEIVSTARSCYDLCCSYDTCNTALMHYKEVLNEIGETETHKYCYLFACGNPSVCTFDDHKRYAVIQLEQEYVSRTVPPTTIAVAETGYEEEKCPPGTPVAMCADNPCEVKTCDAHKDARCKPNFCGGCHAHFYNTDNELLNCTIEVGPVSTLTAVNHNEQALTVTEADYEESPTEDQLAPVEEKHEQKSDPDPYFNSDRREYLTDPSEVAELFNNTTPKTKTSTISETYKTIIHTEPQNLKSIPLLVALIISMLLLVGMIYHFKCARRGKPKKFPVDDGDYLINGMYL